MQRSLFMFFTFLLTGCSLIIGLKPQKKLSSRKIEAYAARYHIPADGSYEVDTLSYKSFCSGITDTLLKKNFRQPLQLRVYKPSGGLQFFLVNCYVGGFPNLQWNRYGTFDVFPPAKGSFSTVASPLKLEDDLKFYRKTGGTASPDISGQPDW